ncbi:MATE family efflux transporter [Oceanotoga teriensis]|uniref:MATE family efflux transporter n=1 Tax=Oceanotoga teriensis TaxID=515440 RepID=UPI0027127B2D|nr:MATE family efflux transporter [Oceanotoga teriensis]MDO7977611.1 MATE family efflux transporter [Oceanotoga teriensis]
MKNRFNILVDIFLISFPLIVQNTLRMLLGTIDKIFVGQLGEDTIAGVGGANQLISLFLVIVFSFSSGFTILVSQSEGKNDKEYTNKLINNTISFSIFLSLLLMSIFYMWSDTFLSWMKIDGIAFDRAYEYFFINIPSIIFIILSSVFSGFFVANKKNFFPMLATVFSMIFNVCFDYFFIIILDFGVLGAAWATFLARILEFIILIFFVYKRFKFENIIFKFNFNKDILKRLLYISLPMTIDGAVWQFAATVNTSLIFRLGTDQMAIFEVLKIFQSIVLTPISALASASVGIIAGYLGKKDYEKANIYSKQSIFLSFLITSILSFIIILFYDNIFDWFKLSQNSVFIGKSLMIYLIFLIFCQTSNIIFPYILRSGGDTWSILFITLFGFWIIQIPLSYILGFVFDFKLNGIFFAMIIGEFFKGTLFFIRYIRKKWIKNLN